MNTFVQISSVKVVFFDIQHGIGMGPGNIFLQVS